MIPQILLEEILNKEKKAKDYYKKYGKENIENALKELEESNRQIFERYSVEKMQTEFNLKKEKLDEQKKLNEFGKISAQNPIKFRTFRIIGLAAAAIFAFAFLCPLAFQNAKKSTESNGVRIKGQEKSLALKMYKKNGQSVISLINEETVEEGETVQIAYVAGKNKYGYIFSIDGNGNLTRHFPDYGWNAEKLNRNSAEVPLDFSYTLDDAPNYECFVFVASEKSFEMSNLKRMEENAEKLDLNFAQGNSYLPEECTKSIFVLKK